ncbi:MAG: sugar ABC transporter ATP-binding protein [Alphaproteobacteria bacterium]|nr:sugar ABC transporter ATP-binding protein [Alphaproteobacteria bacterium]
MSEGPPLLLELKSITKRFPGVLALDRVDFDLRPGEVHILFGENGAGKSTLISIIAGALRPESGRIRFQGQDVELHSVHDARGRGISAVFQEFSLVPQLTVEENLFLGAEITRMGLLDRRSLHGRAKEILGRLGFPIQPSQKVMYLSRAEQQMVEIAKAFRSDLSVLILDEPTSSLTERETNQLIDLIEQAKSDGVGIIYITHRMNEIRRIGNRITILRDGRYVDTVDAKETTDEELVRLMTGRVIEQIFPKIEFRPQDEILEIENISTKNGALREVSVSVRRGEVVGIAGLIGSGKTELARACFGIEQLSAGKIIFDGQDATGLTPRQMLNRGLYYIPPDRREEGLVLMRNVRENVSLSSLHLPQFSGPIFLRRAAERTKATDIAVQLNLQPPSIERAVDHFSGGNQQKVLLGKSLARDVKLFVFDEPTVGVDVGTRVAIYEFIRDLCESGAGVLLVSSDLPEILHLTTRVYVMYRGVLHAELVGGEITESAVLSEFFEKAAA